VTQVRLHDCLEKYKEEIWGVKYVIVFSNLTGIGAEERQLGDMLPVGCNNKWTGLVCRDLEAYKYFLAHRHLGNWLFRAMDDTYVNVTNLLSRIAQLEQVYDPRKHIVLRAAQNNECVRAGRLWIGGGAGWLMSRPMVAAHFMRGFTFGEAGERRACGCTQDDCLTTRIAIRIFGSSLPWADNAMTDSLLSIKPLLDQTKRKRIWKVLECPDNVVNRLRPSDELISAHCGWGNRFSLCARFWQLPYELNKSIYSYVPNNTRGLMFCWVTSEIPKVSHTETLKDLMQKAVFLTLADLRRPMREFPECIASW
jgi:hypothetical protein